MYRAAVILAFNAFKCVIVTPWNEGKEVKLKFNFNIFQTICILCRWLIIDTYGWIGLNPNWHKNMIMCTFKAPTFVCCKIFHFFFASFHLNFKLICFFTSFSSFRRLFFLSFSLFFQMCISSDNKQIQSFLYTIFTLC